MPCPFPLLAHEAAFHPRACVFLLQLRLDQPRVSGDLLEDILCDCALGLRVDPPSEKADDPQREWNQKETKKEERDDGGLGGDGIVVRAEDAVDTVVTKSHVERL